MAKEMKEKEKAVTPASLKKWLVNSCHTHARVAEWLNDIEKKYVVLDTIIEFRGAGSWIVFVRVE